MSHRAQPPSGDSGPVLAKRTRAVLAFAKRNALTDWRKLYEQQRFDSANQPSDSFSASNRADHLRCEGSRDEVSTHRATAPAEGRAEYACDPDRRCWIRIVQCLRRSVSDAHCGA